MLANVTWIKNKGVEMIDRIIGDLLTMYRVWAFPIRYRITPAQPDSRLRRMIGDRGPRKANPAAGELIRSTSPIGNAKSERFVYIEVMTHYLDF